MKRTVVYLLATALFLSGCIPALPSLQQPEEAPAVDVQATDAALALTLGSRNAQRAANSDPGACHRYPGANRHNHKNSHPD